MRVLITGGAGFIGCNAARHYLDAGCTVEVLDNFSRHNVDKNVQWLASHPAASNLEVTRADIRHDQAVLDSSVEQADHVLHLAAQVAVTTSFSNPREDFETNALGTFNVLEALRKSRSRPHLIYASTNKVYGAMEDIRVVELNGRNAYADAPEGIGETRLLDFHSPYGCSKGSADQYVRDYSRMYGLKTTIFRQSCIYGTRQFGLEDQGWIAWFVIAAVTGRPLTIYGDGRQVRDALYVDDLLRAYDLAFDDTRASTGNIYNVGGGAANQLSVLELIGMLESLFGTTLQYSFSDWRPGDQPVFISNIEKIRKELGWKPRVTVHEGIYRISEWAMHNRDLFEATENQAPQAAAFKSGAPMPARLQGSGVVYAGLFAGRGWPE